MRLKNRKEKNTRKDTSLFERLYKLLYYEKKWRRITSVFMAVVVFATTYLLILPALTLDEQTAVEEPGITVASMDKAQPEESDAFIADDQAALSEDGLSSEPAAGADAGIQNPGNEGQSAGNETGLQSTGNGAAEGQAAEAVPEFEGAYADGELLVEDAVLEEADLQEEDFALTEETGDDWNIGVDTESAEDPGKETEQTTEDKEEELPEELKEDSETELIVDEEEFVGTAGELSAEGADYKVVLKYDAFAGIPEGASLYVAEIPETPEAGQSSEYEGFVEKANDILSDSEIISFARFFDISILKDGKEIHPAGPVEVLIELKNELDENVKAVHFEEPESETEYKEENSTPQNSDLSPMTESAEAESIITEENIPKESNRAEDTMRG